MQQTKIFCGIVSALALVVLSVNAYAQVSLRSRVDSSRTFQAIQANCALEFANDRNGFTYVAFGGAGLAIYRYQPGQTPQRIGYSNELSWSITDLAFGPFGSLACVTADANVYLFSFRTSNLSLVPHGLVRSGNAGLNAARVRALRGMDIANIAYLIVGTRTGRLRVYSLFAERGLPPASSFGAPLNVGNPIVDLPLFADSVRALAAWEFPAGQQYIAVGGSDGIVYLYRHYEGAVQLIGKPMEHPAPVEEIVVNGNRLVVALRNGLVYVWNYTSNAVSYHLTIKEPWSPLTAYSLCALPNDRVAVATGSVRVYSLANGAQVGEYGVQQVLGVYNNYHRWYDTRFPSSFVMYAPPRFSPLIRLAPFVGNNSTSYFYVVGLDTYIRTAFLRPPAELLYQVFPSRHPVYAGVSLRIGNPPIAVGLGNGEVRTPWGTRNVGEPVYALAVTGPNNQPWLLGSYGIGRIFAWSSSNNFVPNILPQGAPRILYSVRIVDYEPANNIVRFVTTGGDGRIELWQWNASTPNNPATLLSHQSVSHPLHHLTVNASRTQLAVSSITAPNNQRCAWRLSLGTSLGAATPIEHAMRVVAYHPTDPNLLAWGGTFGDDYWWRGSILLDRPNQQPHYLVRSVDSAYVTWLDWSPDGRLLLAATSKGFVYVLSPDGARNNPKNRDGTTDNQYYGNPVDALRAAYQPHRGYIYAVSAVGNNILTAGADGQAKLFSNSGTPVFEIISPSSSFLASIDYLPNGGVVTPERVVYPPSTRYSPFANIRAAAAFWIPNTSTAFYSTFVVQEIQNNQLRVAGDNQLPDWMRVEISENGQWLLHTFIEGRGDSQPGRLRALIWQRTPSWPYFSRSNERMYQLYQYPSPNIRFATAFSPTGGWIASVATDRVINLYRRSAITGDNPSPNATITYNAATPIWSLRFLADDVLAVLHTSNNILTLDVWYQNPSNGTWQLQQTITLQGVLISPIDGSAYYPIDAVAPSGSSSVRVVLGANGTLIFYRMDRSSSGVPNLVEVGRATSASNGYLDIPSITWVRFSRHNPNILGVVQQARTAITYDLTGLFNW